MDNSSSQTSQTAQTRSLEERASLRQFGLHLRTLENSIALSRLQQLVLLAVDQGTDTRDLDGTIVHTLDGMPFEIEGPTGERNSSLGLYVDWVLCGARTPLKGPEQWMKVRKSRKYREELLLWLDQWILVPSNASIEAKCEAFVEPEPPTTKVAEAPKRNVSKRATSYSALAFLFIVMGSIAVGLAVGVALGSATTSRRYNRMINTKGKQHVQGLLEANRHLKQENAQQQALLAQYDQQAQAYLHTNRRLEQENAQQQAILAQHEQYSQELLRANGRLEQETAQHQALLAQYQHRAQVLEEAKRRLNEQLRAARAASQQQAEVEAFASSLVKNGLIRPVQMGANLLQSVKEELGSTVERITQAVRDARQDYDTCQRELTRANRGMQQQHTRHHHSGGCKRRRSR